MAFAQVLGAAANAGLIETELQVLQINPPNAIAGILIAATLEESYEDVLEVTEHPVEAGAQITDHSFKRPREVTLKCGWSNSSQEALVGTLSTYFAGGGFSTPDYVTDVYAQLLTLQLQRTPFQIQTTFFQYNNMVLRSLFVTRDEKTGNALMVTAVCREVIFVSTQSALLPPLANQANPSSTAETQKGGATNLISGKPNPGGALPPSLWTPF
jgi:hypothetical protein